MSAKYTKEDLIAEIEDVQKQMELLVSENVRLDDLYNAERTKRVRAEKLLNGLEVDMSYYKAQLETAKELRAVEKKRRHGTIPKFVIVAASALLMMVIPYSLQQMAVIGPQTAYTIQCVLMMVIAWCYAIIWDRSRN